MEWVGQQLGVGMVHHHPTLTVFLAVPFDRDMSKWFVSLNSAVHCTSNGLCYSYYNVIYYVIII